MTVSVTQTATKLQRTEHLSIQILCFEVLDFRLHRSTAPVFEGRAAPWYNLEKIAKDRTLGFAKLMATHDYRLLPIVPFPPAS